MKIKLLILGLLVALISHDASAIEVRTEKHLGQDIKKISQLILAQRFARAETYILNISKENSRTEKGANYLNRLLSEVLKEKKGEFPSYLLEPIEQWVDQYPESFISRLVRGIFLIGYASEVRVNGVIPDEREVENGDDDTGINQSSISKDKSEVADRIEKQAVRDLKLSIRYNSNNPVGYLSFLHYYIMKNREADVEKIFNQAVKINPSEGDLYIGIINYIPEKAEYFLSNEIRGIDEISLARIKIAAHKNIYKRLRASNDLEFEGYFEREDIWNDISTSFEILMSKTAPVDFYKIEYAKLAYIAGKNDIAEKMFDVSIARDTESPSLFIERGDFYHDIQAYDKAIHDYASYIRLRPDEDLGYAKMAYIYLLKGEFSDSNSLYAKAMIYDLDNVVYLSLRCYNFRSMGKFGMARNDCYNAIEINPDYAEPYNQLYLLNEEEAKFKKARQYYDEYLKRTDINAYNERMSKRSRNNMLKYGGMAFAGLVLIVFVVRRRRKAKA